MFNLTDNFNEDDSEKYVEDNYNVGTQSSYADKWEEFIRGFTKRVGMRYKGSDDFIEQRDKIVYFEQINQLPSTDRIKNHYISQSKYTLYEYEKSSLFIVNYEHIESWLDKDNKNDLVQVLSVDADLALKALKDAAFNILKDLHPDYANEIKSRFEVSISNYNRTKEIPDISSKDVGKLLRVEGFVASYDDKRRQITLQSYWNCNGLNENEEIHENIVEGGNRPPYCAFCESKKLKEDVVKRDITDFIDIKLQQRMDRVREGSVAQIDARLIGSEKVALFYDQFDPGAIFNATVIPRLIYKNERDRTIADTYLEILSIDKQAEEELVEHDEMLEEIVKQVPDNDIDAHVRKLYRSIAPTIMGLDHLKFALLLALVGAEPRMGEDLQRVRGTIKILIVGDTSCGKSTMLRHAALIIPKSMYVSTSASAVGLVAGINIEDKVKKITLGILPMANNGLACIDELDKRDKEDFEKISEPMDDNEMIYLNKAGIAKPIQARCTVLAAANPVTNGGRIDPLMSIMEQTKFPSWLVSRFDLVFMVRSVTNSDQDNQFLQHMNKVFTGRRLESDFILNGKRELSISTKSGDIYQTHYLRHELQYLKQTYKPILKPTDPAWHKMMKWYLQHKSMIIPKMIDAEDKVSKKSNVETPMVDHRKLRTLENLAAASARLYRRNEITEDDMQNAINVLEFSINSIIPENENINWNHPDLVNLDNKRTQEFMKTQAFSKLQKLMQLQGKQMKFFIAQVKKNLWQRCDICKGQGFTYEDAFGDVGQGGKPIKCDECNGLKGYYADFDFEILAETITSTRGSVPITYDDCREIFKILKENGFFRQTRTSVPGHIRYELAKNPDSIDIKDQIEKLTNLYELKQSKEPIQQKSVPKADIMAKESVEKELEEIRRRKQERVGSQESDTLDED